MLQLRAGLCLADLPVGVVFEQHRCDLDTACLDPRQLGVRYRPTSSALRGHATASPRVRSLAFAELIGLRDAVSVIRRVSVPVTGDAA